MAGLAEGVARVAVRPPLVLASASPRRADLLADAGYGFEVSPTSVDETPRAGEPPLDYCVRMAREKAAEGARGVRSGTVLGGDTVVIVAGDILGKPADRVEAGAMLRRLAGREHQVASAVALRDVRSGREVYDIGISDVRFDPLSAAQLDDYLACGEWEGKAGAYAIQGRAARFAHLVRGALDTVIGLPVDVVRELASRLEEKAS